MQRGAEGDGGCRREVLEREYERVGPGVGRAWGVAWVEAGGRQPAKLSL